MSSTTEWLTSQKILARVEVEITCTDSFAKAVCLAASTIAERASDFFFHAGLPTVMGEASGKDITICGDGKQTRDFIYAGDIAHGIAAALRTDHANRAYNLSTQQETSLNELVELLSLIAGRKIHPRYAKGRPGDIYHSLLANGRARRFLLWSPSVSLEEGLRRTYAAVK